MIVLGIETSCDETSAAVVRDGGEVLSNVVYTQIAKHRPYGGVVPEIASRSHVELLPGILDEAVREARTEWCAIDRVAVTRGPGLASSLLVGLSAAKALSLRLDRPYVGVNHLHAHLYSVFLGAEGPSPDAHCPMIVLLVSGGHTCLVYLKSPHEFRLLGQTLDDAAGEALDKGATLLGLGYPGGPAVQKAAHDGNPKAVAFPRGLRTSSPERTCEFSFSGLKTALRYYLEANPDVLKNGGLADVAASYEEAVVDALVSKLEAAVVRERVQHFACVGGVARNARLRARLKSTAERLGKTLWLASPEYCTDNAAMVAALAGSPGASMAEGRMELDVDPNLIIGES